MAQVVATRSIQVSLAFRRRAPDPGGEEPSPRAQAFDATPEVLPPGKVAEDRDRQLLLVPTPVYFLDDISKVFTYRIPTSQLSFLFFPLSLFLLFHVEDCLSPVHYVLAFSFITVGF